MAPPKVLFSLLFSSLLVVMLVKKVESQHTNFAINTFTPDSPLLTYERVAFVPSSSPYVRMTAVNTSGLPRQNSVGRVLYKAPVHLWGEGRQASIETTISLEMTPVSNNFGSTGHGITFFIVPLNSLRPFCGLGNNLGIYDAVAPGTPIFAVEFDLNNGGIMNPIFPHIGINIHTIRSQVVTLAPLARNREITRINYEVPTKEISVVAYYGSTRTTLSFYFNLKALFSQQVQIGLSASTGTQRLAFLDVYVWQFRATMGPDIIGDHNNNNNNNNTVIKQYVM